MGTNIQIYKIIHKHTNIQEYKNYTRIIQIQNTNCTKSIQNYTNYIKFQILIIQNYANTSYTNYVNYTRIVQKYIKLQILIILIIQKYANTKYTRLYKYTKLY